MSSPDPVIVAQGVVKTFGPGSARSIRAVDDISMTVPSGQLTALVGPDGAGKTTLLRMIAGLFAPDAGQLTVLTENVIANPQSVQDKISYMPQRFGLYEDLSVLENLNLYADLHGVPQDERRERFARMLAMTDLARFTDRTAGKLSGGMKQKLGLACTLVRSPNLLLLDEPSVGVDPLSRRDLWSIIQQLVEQEQLSVLVSTAYMDEAERCAHVFVMHRGRILAQDTPDALRQRARGLTYTAQPAPGTHARELQARLIATPERIVDAVPKGGAVHFMRRADTAEESLRDLLGDVHFEPREEELEDTFMLMLRQQQQQEFPATPITAAHTVTDPTWIAAARSDSARAVILVRDLVRKFGDFTAVANTSFEVRRGEIFGLLGPNGAGKTTTFRMLCGLLPATSGQIEVAGLNLRVARARARARLGYVSQKFALYGSLTVRENLEFFGGVYGLSKREIETRIATALEQFELDPSADSGELPGGFKQRLAMAAALLHRPEILFLDEPTSGIDPLARRSFWQTIGELAQSGVTIIVTTHFMEEAEYCDRIAIQDAGKMLALGTPQEVREQAGASHATDMNSAFIAIVEQARKPSPAQCAPTAAGRV